MVIGGGREGWQGDILVARNILLVLAKTQRTRRHGREIIGVPRNGNIGELFLKFTAEDAEMRRGFWRGGIGFPWDGIVV